MVTRFGDRFFAPRVVGSTLATLLCLATALASAQTRFEGKGRVVTVDETKGAVTLDHGPIPGLMAPMRMEFPVARGELLRGLQVGQMVRFSLQPRGPEWVIAAMAAAEPPPSTGPATVPAPDFTLPTLSGETVRLADRRGKVVLLNFWATWCVPCRTEMPAIERLYQRYGDQGLDVLAINLDVLSPAGVGAFVKETKVTFPIVLDPSWSTPRVYGVIGLPTTYLIDRAGNVVVREVGERDWEDDLSQTAVKALLR